ncbi:Exosome complex component rrp4 [Smittium culicis]|uniref:Exosome complex component rrp4 n=1 Tax=Smittium culicis TaxID=133412 RepID=A0A1R1XM06_9FUNG|nr:Exosome complex component rrp4 [Smittium culicis]
MASLADGSTSNDNAKKIVTPGTLITSDPSFMKGHGTFVEDGKIYASVAGTVERINRLISVKSFGQRFVGEIGDTIVGRITRVTNKRWMVDINSKQDAVLLLSSINLPGGIQRRKSESDELMMRHFFKEGDLVFAEVQALFGDGALSLHTRNIEYGKLKSGLLVSVNPDLVVRSRNHVLLFGFNNVQAILGKNGLIFVRKYNSIDSIEKDINELYSDTNLPISSTEREELVRVANSITLLNRLSITINQSTITSCYELGQDFKSKDILTLNVANSIADQVRIQISQN